MATTTVASANQRQEFEKKFFAEYVRDSLFAPYMGEDENSIIQVKTQLTDNAGLIINVPLVTRLTSTGVTGDNTLEGNEEAMLNYNHALNIAQIRNAISFGVQEQQSTAIDLMKAGRQMLKLWIMDDLRDAILTAMGSAKTDGTTAYGSCTEAERDAWLAANYVSATNTRILFGAVASNSSTEDHSTSLGNVDSTTDKFLFATVQLMKRLLKKADPHIRPVKVNKGREYYVAFVESYSFRDLKTDMVEELRDAHTRGSDNPLFQDPDLEADGVLVREVPEIAVISGVGNGGIDVAPNYFCGAQAVGCAWSQRSKFVTQMDDYENLQGVAVSEIRGVEKLTYNSFQHGMGTLYTSGVADS